MTSAKHILLSKLTNKNSRRNAQLPEPSVKHDPSALTVHAPDGVDAVIWNKAGTGAAVGANVGSGVGAGLVGAEVGSVGAGVAGAAVTVLLTHSRGSHGACTCEHVYPEAQSVSSTHATQLYPMSCSDLHVKAPTNMGELAQPVMDS